MKNEANQFVKEMLEKRKRGGYSWQEYEEFLTLRVGVKILGAG